MQKFSEVGESWWLQLGRKFYEKMYIFNRASIYKSRKARGSEKCFREPPSFNIVVEACCSLFYFQKNCNFCTFLTGKNEKYFRGYFWLNRGGRFRRLPCGSRFAIVLILLEPSLWGVSSGKQAKSVYFISSK